MNVQELSRLAGWFAEEYPALNNLYTALVSPLQHNANQSSKQPLESQMEALIAYLRAMKFDALSIQQLNLLSKLGVDQFIGQKGADYVSSSIKTSEYDPVTAGRKIEEAINLINRTQSSLEAYRNSIKALGVEGKDLDGDLDHILIRIGFQNDAAINHVVDWKNYSRDWYDIIRGIALSIGEAPEETKVVGASNGSIILVLSGTLLLTTILAKFSKQISGIAKDTISVMTEIETLRQKKLLTKTMESELRKIEKDRRDEGIQALLDDTKKLLPPEADGEASNALENSIKKLLTFNEKGGNVDFVAPDVSESDDDDAEDQSAMNDALAAAREAIQEYQTEREAVKLLIAQNDKND